MIKAENLHKNYKELKVLQGIDLTIAQGECVALIGGSGAGKSVLLRCLAMLEVPDKGKIWIGNEEITRPGCNLNKMRERMGMVYQGFHLFSHLNVLENIALAPQKILGLSPDKAEERARELLDMIGLAGKAKAMPQELSGGQSQRIAIARCLAMDPKIILFDEPTSALDPRMAGEVLAIIRKLLGRGITMLLVTHEMNFAQEAASRVLFLDEGTIYEEGTPKDIFEHPKLPRTQSFVNRLRHFHYEISGGDFDLIALAASVDQFCQKYGLSKNYSFTSQLLLEELLTVLAEKFYPADMPAVDISMEYSETVGKLKLSLSYLGEKFDIINHGLDEIQYKLVVGKTQSREYAFADGVNHLQIFI